MFTCATVAVGLRLCVVGKFRVDFGNFALEAVDTCTPGTSRVASRGVRVVTKLIGEKGEYPSRPVACVC